jgi:hypothetical protein
MTRAGEAGRGLLGALSVLAALGLLLASSAALHSAWRRRAVEGAAESLASLLRALSVASLSDGRDRALVFPAAGRNEPLFVARDESGDGVTRDDIEHGRDSRGPAFSVARDHPGVRIDLPASGSVPWPPPAGPLLRPGSPAIRFGPARIAVVSAAGHATPGSLFVSDGSDGCCAVVVNGATARVRVWCLDARADRWRLR